MKKSLLVVLSLLLTIPGSTLMAELRVLPTPKYASEERGSIRFGRLEAAFSEAAEDPASIIELEHYFGKNFTQKKTRSRDVVLLETRLLGNTPPENMPAIPPAIRDSVLSSPDGYFLFCRNRRIEILANTRTGIFYGVATLLQLVQKDKRGYMVPVVTVADYPSLRMRGISDDISRGQISKLDNFKKIIRFIAMYKMNVYMPYIENEFDFKMYPDFSEGRAPLTVKEVAELDKYGKLYHVDIIPAFETLGHMEDVLYKKEFEKYAEFPGATCIDISSDSAFGFMKNLLSEIAPAFSSKYFNMSADESFDVGLGASKHLVDSLGIDEAHAEYYKKVYNVLKSLGKQVMMYGDIILKNPNILSEIPKDITIVDWHYGASFDYPSVQVFKQAGFPFLSSPAVWNFIGPFPNFYNSYANIQYFAREGYEGGAEGLLVSTWNDNGGADLRELNYPGYAWGAECAWNPATSSAAHFENVFFPQYFQTKSQLPRIVYELLSSPGNQISWYEFWRAPFVSMRDYNVPSRTESIESSIPEVLTLIKEARKVVGANEDILDLYELAAKMDKYWADKVTDVIKMRYISADSMLSPPEKEEQIKPIEDHLLSTVAYLKAEYTRLYLRTNRYPMLQLLEGRFEDQEKDLKQGTAQMLAGNSDYNQLIESQFIYYPDSRPYSREGSKVDSATFQKSFNLAELPKQAELQLIGDTYCKLYVNGTYLGDVKARRTLTLNVERKRVQVFDIGSFLQKGNNTITVQAVNFNKLGSAGCNVTALLGNDTLRTDNTWKVAEGIVAPDTTANVSFVGAMGYDNGWTVTAPDFSLKLRSWIER